MALTKLPGFTLDSTANFTFANVTVSGNLTSGNANLGNAVTANYFLGNGSQLSGITASTATTAATVTTNAQPNITSVGTLTNLTITGNITSGNANLGNLVTANYFTGNGSLLTGITATTATTAATVTTNAQPNITSTGTLSALTVTGTIVATAGGVKVGNIQDPSGTNTLQLTSGSIVVTGNITAGGGGSGNVTATYFIGNGSQLTGLPASYSNTNVAAYLPTYTGNVSANYFIGNGATLTSITGSNVSGNVTSAVQSHYANIANSVAGGNISGQVGNALVAGTVYTAAQPNITSTGTLSSLTVTGNVTSGNANLGNLATATYFTGGDLSITRTALTNSIYFDGTNYANLTASTSMLGSGDYTIEFWIKTTDGDNGIFTNLNTGNSPTTGPAIFMGSNNLYFQARYAVATTLNVSGASLLDNAWHHVAFVRESGTVSVYFDGSRQDFVSNSTDYSSVVSGYNFGNSPQTFNKLTGYLSNFRVVNGTALYTGTSFTVPTSPLTAISGTTLLTLQSTTLIDNSSYARSFTTTGSPVIGSSVVPFAGYIGTGNISASNISSSTAITGVDMTLTGNLTVSGSFIYANVTSFNVKDPIIEQGGNPNGTPLASNDGKDRGQILHYYSSAAIDAFMGWDNSNAEFAFGSNVSVSSEVVTFNSFGNLRAGYFLGNGSQLSGVIASSATTAGTVTTAAQPNITSVGTLSSLTITGNLTSGNANLGNAATANYFTGTEINVGGTILSSSGFTTTGAAGGNITGANYVTANYFTGTLTTGAQPNITSTGTLTSLTVTGNVTANYFIGNGSQLTGLPASYSNTNVAAYLPTYTGNLTAGNITGVTLVSATNLTGTLTTGAQPNITSTGTLTSLTITGNVTSGNANLGNAATANYFTGTQINVGGTILSSSGFTTSGAAGGNVTGANYVTANYFTGTITTASQPNITSVGTLASLTVTANIISGNANLGNAVVANYFVGDGSLLTGLPASYSNTNVAAYLPTYTGNVSANYFIGNGATLTYVTGGNVNGQVGNSLIAGTVYTNAQPNITSVGTLASLTVTANATAGNIKTDNLLYSNGTAWSFGGTPGGSNTYVQFNDGSSFGGNAGLTFNKTTTTLTTNNFTATSTANLGAVGNITITGGTANYVLSTNGSGVLSWVAQSSGSSTAITVDNFTGNGVQTTFTLSTTPTSINQVSVNYNGTSLLRASYSLSGANVTFGSAPASGSLLEITTLQGTSAGTGTFTTRTYTGTGSQTDYTVTSGTTVSSVLVSLSGVLQVPTTDYTISGTTLTFTTAPPSSVDIQIRELGVVVASGGSALTIKEDGSNLTTAATSIDFVGAGITATNVGSAVTVTVPTGTTRAQAMVMGIIFGG